MNMTFTEKELDIIKAALCTAYCKGEGFLFSKDNAKEVESKIAAVADKIAETQTREIAIAEVSLTKRRIDGRRMGGIGNGAWYTVGCTVWENEHGDIATMTCDDPYGEGEWFVDLGCSLWNRAYKTRRGAENYLTKNGYKPIYSTVFGETAYIHRDTINMMGNI